MSFLRYQSYRKIDLRWADALLGKAASCFFYFVSCPIGGQLLGGKNLLQWEQVLPFESGPYFERAVLSWKAHRKSHGLFPFEERIENYGNVSVPLKGLVETSIYKTSIPLLLPCCTDTYPIFQSFDTVLQNSVDIMFLLGVLNVCTTGEIGIYIVLCFLGSCGLLLRSCGGTMQV